jgi:hypothetical protein
VVDATYDDNGTPGVPGDDRRGAGSFDVALRFATAPVP